MENWEDYDKLLQKQMELFKEVNMKEFSNENYSLFYPMVGKDFLEHRELMIVGRSPNKWETTWNSNDDILKKITESKSNSSFIDPKYKCPLDWLNNETEFPGLYRSSLLRVYYKIQQARMRKLGFDDNKIDRTWTYRTVYSNLLKISPANGGNPYREKYSSQMAIGGELYKLEMAILKPKFVVVITGDWIYDFTRDLTDDSFKDIRLEDSKFICLTCTFRESRIIVTQRPEGKNEDSFVKAVLCNFD